MSTIAYKCVPFQSKLADISRDFKGVLELRTEVMGAHEFCDIIVFNYGLNFVELETTEAETRAILSVSSYLSTNYIWRR